MEMRVQKSILCGFVIQMFMHIKCKISVVLIYVQEKDFIINECKPVKIIFSLLNKVISEKMNIFHNFLHTKAEL